MTSNSLRTHFDLSLYLILDPELCGGIEGMVETTRLAVEAGATFVQLRSEREIDKREWYEAAVALKALLKPLNIPFVINDQVDIALAVDADGVHIGQRDLPYDVARHLLGEGKIIGLTVGSEAELANVDRAMIDYIGVGPVYQTSTKKDARSALGLNGLRAIVEQNRTRYFSEDPLPIVAIGGINAENGAEVMAQGVEGVSVISAICGQPNVTVATKALYRAIKEE